MTRLKFTKYAISVITAALFVGLIILFFTTVVVPLILPSVLGALEKDSSTSHQEVPTIIMEESNQSEKTEELETGNDETNTNLINPTDPQEPPYEVDTNVGPEEDSPFYRGSYEEFFDAYSI